MHIRKEEYHQIENKTSGCLGMNLKGLYLKIIKRCKELWSYKIFRFTVIVQVFYFIFSLILTLFFLREQNDFLVYYKVGEVFITDINDLYTADYLWPFRYFPISAIFFVPFYLLGFDLGYAIFNLLNLLLNVIICVFLYKIIFLVRAGDHEKDDKRIVTYICLFLMGLPNLFNYILGQINLYITLLILVSLFLFLTREDLKWNLISSIILGFSIIIKPITIFMVPFLLVLNLRIKHSKFEFKALKSIVRIIGVVAPLTLNIFLFLIYPALWDGFLTANLSGSDPIMKNHSFSLTKIILNFFNFYSISNNPFLVLLIVLLIIGGLSFIIYVFRRISKNSLIFGYIFGILIMLLVYYDSWTHHLLALTPLLIILIFYLPRNSKITKNYIKPSFFFLNFFDLAFMGIWFIIQDFFPYNFVSAVFLLIILYGSSKFCLTEDSNY
ncbi:MAG: glycosyltransferase family 87 protein [Candidatus Hodarchaeota archaeon]